MRWSQNRAQRELGLRRGQACAAQLQYVSGSVIGLASRVFRFWSIVWKSNTAPHRDRVHRQRSEWGMGGVASGDTAARASVQYHHRPRSDG